MNLQSIYLLLRYNKLWLVSAVLALLIINLLSLKMGSDTLSACYLIVFLATVVLSLLQLRIIPVYNSFLNISPQSLALFNHGLLVFFALEGLIPLLIIRLAKGTLDTSVFDIVTALLLSFATALMLLRIAVIMPLFPVYCIGPTINFFGKVAGSPELIMFNRWAWPAYTIIIVIALAEFPEFLKACNKAKAKTVMPFIPCDIYGPKGPNPLTMHRGAIIWLFVLVVALILTPDFLRNLNNGFQYPMILIGIIIIQVCVFTAERSKAIASGLSPAKSQFYALTAIFGIGYCYRFAFGVRDGQTANCKNCGKLRMNWMHRCPHCLANPREICIIPNKAPVQSAPIAFAARRRPLHKDEFTTLFRYGMIAILFVIWWFNYMGFK